VYIYVCIYTRKPIFMNKTANKRGHVYRYAHLAALVYAHFICKSERVYACMSATYKWTTGQICMDLHLAVLVYTQLINDQQMHA